jgi:hypothetical protein
MQAPLMNTIQFAMKMAEDVTGLPMLMQGQAGSHTPDTVGGMVMLQNNSGAVLRRIARTFDDRITEPHIRRYYEWLLIHGENDDEKGDFVIDARGSTALVERDAANMALMQMGQFVGNPAFGIDPAKYMAEWLKSQRIDPNKVLMDDEQKARMANQPPPPPPPQIQVAQIRAEAEMALATTRKEGEIADLEVRRQIAENNHAANIAKLQLEREIEMLRLANEQKISLDEIKAKLASDAMKIKAQTDMANADRMIDAIDARTNSTKRKTPELLKPPTEPVGQAPIGHSWQQ